MVDENASFHHRWHGWTFFHFGTNNTTFREKSWKDHGKYEYENSKSVFWCLCASFRATQHTIFDFSFRELFENNLILSFTSNKSQDFKGYPVRVTSSLAFDGAGKNLPKNWRLPNFFRSLDNKSKAVGNRKHEPTPLWLEQKKVAKKWVSESLDKR